MPESTHTHARHDALTSDAFSYRMIHALDASTRIYARMIRIVCVAHAFGTVRGANRVLVLAREAGGACGGTAARVLASGALDLAAPVALVTRRTLDATARAAAVRPGTTRLARRLTSLVLILVRARACATRRAARAALHLARSTLSARRAALTRVLASRTVDATSSSPVCHRHLCSHFDVTFGRNAVQIF